MLVLGFQELDQSTEALLYATSTLREEEWLTAIFAGLGEKRVLYEKASPCHFLERSKIDCPCVPLAYFKAARRHANYCYREKRPRPLLH